MRKLLVITFIFFFSLSLRIWNLDKMGRTWDEGAYVELGYKYIALLKKRDFKNDYWYKQSDEPPLARYVYGFLGQWDISHFDKNGNPIFKYDLTSARLVAVLLSSLSTVLVVVIGWSYISAFVGISAGFIFSMLPFFVGLSQLATLESFVMFFYKWIVNFHSD